MTSLLTAIKANSKRTHPDPARLSAAKACTACRDGHEIPFPFSMAFQPVVDIETRSVYAYEALCRGPENQTAFSVLSQVTPENRYAFDQQCRVQAITLASRLGLAHTGAKLSINFMPGAVYSPAACIQLTLRTAEACSFPLDRLIFEVTEDEEIADRDHLNAIVKEYQRHGFQIALDDFGAGYSGMQRLAEVKADVLKLDREMVRDIDTRPAAAQVVLQLRDLAAGLNMLVVAEGIETVAEYRRLRDCGISHMQGYLFARPAFEMLPEAVFPE